MNLEERIAKMVIGPREPLPETAKFTIDQLRQFNWDRADSNTKGNAKWIARTIIRELKLKED